VAQLRSSSKDPQVAAGLAAIAKLDADLREASLKVGAVALAARDLMAESAFAPHASITGRLDGGRLHVKRPPS
jgi:hypothetical protein